jgi:hypothetical protein
MTRQAYRLCPAPAGHKCVWPSSERTVGTLSITDSGYEVRGKVRFYRHVVSSRSGVETWAVLRRDEQREQANE